MSVCVLVDVCVCVSMCVTVTMCVDGRVGGWVGVDGWVCLIVLQEDCPCPLHEHGFTMDDWSALHIDSRREQCQ